MVAFRQITLIAGGGGSSAALRRYRGRLRGIRGAVGKLPSSSRDKKDAPGRAASSFWLVGLAEPYARRSGSGGGQTLRVNGSRCFSLVWQWAAAAFHAPIDGTAICRGHRAF